MHFRLLPSDIVQVCVPAELDSDTEDTVSFNGTVAVVNGDTLTVVLSNSDLQSYTLFRPSSICVLRKFTPLGVLEFDATGDAHCIEKRLILTLKILTPPRTIQRRAACRIGLRSEVRYRDLGLGSESYIWKTGELYDVSLGGASLLIPDDILEIGQEVAIEFSLFDSFFSLPAVLRRIESQPNSNALLCAFEYLKFDIRQQNRLAKAIIRLQLKMISSRIEVDWDR